ncbi:hypothetical protein NQZ68_025471 [Dissostichus eleginoides]|nr:hypothetical protein NQZ68_025471 [Dissostichus eleginoides]
MQTGPEAEHSVSRFVNRVSGPAERGDSSLVHLLMLQGFVVCKFTYHHAPIVAALKPLQTRVCRDGWLLPDIVRSPVAIASPAPNAQRPSKNCQDKLSTGGKPSSGSLTTFLEKVEARQRFLLCIGEQRKKIQRLVIVVDHKPIPCNAQTLLAAFDALFKAFL